MTGEQLAGSQHLGLVDRAVDATTRRFSLLLELMLADDLERRLLA
jgi:hypothetical protein